MGIDLYLVQQTVHVAKKKTARGLPKTERRSYPCCLFSRLDSVWIPHISWLKAITPQRENQWSVETRNWVRPLFRLANTADFAQKAAGCWAHVLHDDEDYVINWLLIVSNHNFWAKREIPVKTFSYTHATQCRFTFSLMSWKSCLCPVYVWK